MSSTPVVWRTSRYDNNYSLRRIFNANRKYTPSPYKSRTPFWRRRAPVYIPQRTSPYNPLPRFRSTSFYRNAPIYFYPKSTPRRRRYTPKSAPKSQEVIWKDSGRKLALLKRPPVETPLSGQPVLKRSLLSSYDDTLELSPLPVDIPLPMSVDSSGIQPTLLVEEEETPMSSIKPTQLFRLNQGYQ